ncbi:MAG: rhomboid family intramembrane serine protease [Pirellulaceae bacterium]|nr:rhomboid family intramembrane serine protease [Pirellulaceae bacterium]
MADSKEAVLVIQPVTGLLAVSSIAVTIRWWIEGDVDVFTLDFRVWSEPWRLFTSVLPHIGLLHLVFNIYWLFVFGGKVETEFGSFKTALTFLLLGVGASLAEYAFSYSGVGLSGIGYGLFGFLWVLSRNDARFANAVSPQVVLLFVFWFFLCIALTITGAWQVGNVAHGAGALLGGLLGYCVVARTSNARHASRLLLVGVFASIALAASVGRPYLNLTGIVADEYAYLGYRALEDGNATRAVRFLEQAVEKQQGASENWYNLGVAYYRCSRFDDAIKAYERAIELSPDNETYMTALTDLKKYIAAPRQPLMSDIQLAPHVRRRGGGTRRADQ